MKFPAGRFKGAQVAQVDLRKPSQTHAGGTPTAQRAHLKGTCASSVTSLGGGTSGAP